MGPPIRLEILKGQRIPGPQAFFQPLPSFRELNLEVCGTPKLEKYSISLPTALEAIETSKEVLKDMTKGDGRKLRAVKVECRCEGPEEEDAAAAACAESAVKKWFSSGKKARRPHINPYGRWQLVRPATSPMADSDTDDDDNELVQFDK
ncbi:unnamed protein product [Pleuronectes platessa]|uniref:Uncharacterized protein n=1 Tax=Pleuronectes platessa TaxID=8262 RepID=A0A9N7YVX1_PLEPL|nr:unnamed protein product [Pleuronectes platessa]